MKKRICKFIYFLMSLTVLLIGIIVKLFLVDIDLGARFKNFNNELLSSDILFIGASIIFLIGFLFLLISKNTKATLKDSTILKSAFLLMPIILILSATPFLMTYLPNKSGEGILSTMFISITFIGTFTFFAWVILILFTFIKQLFVILFSK